MITAVRLLPRDEKKGHGMLTYFSANSRTKYTAGDGVNPSPFRVIRSQGEIAELEKFPQFEILEFDSMDQLHEYVQQEMEERARLGQPAIRAAILGNAAPAKVVPKKVVPRKATSTRLPPAANGPQSDPSATNTGRKPTAPTAPTAPVAPEKKPSEPPKPKPKVPEATMEMKKKTLLSIAKKVGADVGPRATKAEILAAIKGEAQKRSMRPAEDE